MRKVLSTSKGIRSIYTNLHIVNMDPTFQFRHLDPANRFAMEGLNMAFAAELHRDRKPLPKLLFIDIMVEKT